MIPLSLSSAVRSAHWPSAARSAVWLVLVLCVALTAALLPVDLVFVCLTGAILVVTALITPIAGAAALLILAPLRTLIATESTLALPLDIGQIALLVVLGTWLIREIALRGSFPRLSWSPFVLPVLLFLGVAGLTGFSAQSVGLWLPEWLKWAQIVIVLIFVRCAAGRANWRWFLASLVAGGAANAVIGIYQFFGGSGALHLLISDRFFRAFGTFGQPNPFGGFMGLLLPLAATGALASIHAFRASPDRRYLLLITFYVLSSVLMLCGLLMSWSRGAWLGLAAAATVLVAAIPRQLWHGLALVAAGLGVALTLWLTGWLPGALVARATSAAAELFTLGDVRGVSITTENYAVVERLSHWQAALNMARSHPWFGVGLGNYEYAYASYRLINWPEPLGHAHNYYLNVLAEGGLIGLIGYGKVWLLIVVLTWRALRHPDTATRLVVAGLLGSWIYLLVHSLFDNLYVNNVFLYLGVMLGIASLLYDDAKRCITLRFV